MDSTKPPYWFHAKRYGFGWGLPARREGWIVLLTWLLLIISLGSWIITHSILLYALFMIAMAAALIAICYAKGEPTRWRWGK